MQRLYWLGLVVSAGMAIGCSDSSPTMQPMFDGGTGGGGVDAAGSPGTGGGAAAGAPGTGGGAMAGAPAGGSGGGGAGGVSTGGTSATGGAGGAAGAAVLAPPAPTGLASINDDTRFQTASLSILDPAGGLKKPDCVDSHVPSGGSTPLISSDVVLPSQPQRGGNVVIVDRTNGALTSVNPSSCSVVHQVAVPNGAKTDPHDVVIVADDKAYVTRYLDDLTATTDSAKGNDVAVIDPTTGAFKSRIDLDAYASTVAGTTILVRPDRALIADGKIVVSLNEVDVYYANYGQGQVVIIDPATDTVTASVALGSLLDCEGMAYVAASKTLLVSCGGAYLDPNQPLESGIAVVDLGASPPKLVQAISAVAFGGVPLNFSWVLSAPTATSPTRAFANTADPNAVLSDVLYAFDFATGAVTQVATSPAFTLGPSAATASLLFVPEFLPSAPKIQLYDITSTPQATSAFAPETTIGLSPTEVAWY